MQRCAATSVRRIKATTTRNRLHTRTSEAIIQSVVPKFTQGARRIPDHSFELQFTFDYTKNQNKSLG